MLHRENQLLVFHEFLLVPKKSHFVFAVGQKMLGTSHVGTSWWALSKQPTSVSRLRCQELLSWTCLAFRQARLSPKWSVPADNSPPTLRAEALSPSNCPTTSVSSASLNLTFDENIQFEGTRTVDLCTNSVAGSGAGSAHAKYADGSFAVNPVTSENVSWRILAVVLDQELHPNQTVYTLIDAKVVPDSSGQLSFRMLQ